MEHLLKYRLSPNSLPNMICNPFQSLIQPDIKRKNYAFVKLIKMPAALKCVNCNYCIELYEKKSGVLSNNMIMTCWRMCFS